MALEEGVFQRGTDVEWYLYVHAPIHKFLDLTGPYTISQPAAQEIPCKRASNPSA